MFLSGKTECFSFYVNIKLRGKMWHYSTIICTKLTDFNTLIISSAEIQNYLQNSSWLYLSNYVFNYWLKFEGLTDICLNTQQSCINGICHGLFESITFVFGEKTLRHVSVVNLIYTPSLHLLWVLCLPKLSDNNKIKKYLTEICRYYSEWWSQTEMCHIV